MRRYKHRSVDHEEVVGAAIGVAFDLGLHAVTVPNVCERLQVPERSLRERGGAFEEIIAEAFSRIVSAELAEVKRLVLAHPSPTQQMRALLETLAEPVRVEVDSVWLESWSLGRRNLALGAAVREEESAWHAFVAAVIRRGVKTGDFLPVDAETVASQILAMIDGVNAYSLVGYQSDLNRMRLLMSIAQAELGLRVETRQSTV